MALLLILLSFNCNWVNTRWQQRSLHLHTKCTQNTEEGTHIIITMARAGGIIKIQLRGIQWEANWEVPAVPRFCKLYPYICLTTEEIAQNNLRYGSRKVPRFSGDSCAVHIYTQTVHRTAHLHRTGHT
jgi:hypothetical protein